jgi:hypothetical protein
LAGRGFASNIMSSSMMMSTMVRYEMSEKVAKVREVKKER